MKYRIFISDIFFKLFTLNFSNMKIIEYFKLKNKVNEAKSKVIFSKFDKMIFVKNEEIIRKILGLENSLGTALFIRWYICMNTPTSKCAEYLLGIK